MAALTRAKVLWNDEALWMGAEMEEPHVWGTLTERDAVIYLDDDFEVFLDDKRPQNDIAGTTSVSLQATSLSVD